MDLRTTFRNSFLAGVLLVAPLAVTAFVLQFVFARLVGLLDPIVQGTRLTRYTANDILAAQLLAAVSLVVGIALLGYLAQRSLGQRAVRAFDRLVGVIPLVNVVYTGVRQVSNALADRNDRYESVVLVEWPKEGIYAIGFRTGTAPSAVEQVAGGEVANVFLPHSPNPTGGKLALIPVDRVHETDMSVRHGLRLLVTTGMADTEAEFEQLREESDAPSPA